MSKQILVVQPHYEGPKAREHLRAFWTAQDADPAGVVVVTVDDKLAGVFSTYDAAMKHARVAGDSAVVVPKRLDDPQWGNAVIQ